MQLFNTQTRHTKLAVRTSLDRIYNQFLLTLQTNLLTLQYLERYSVQYLERYSETTGKPEIRPHVQAVLGPKLPIAS